MYGYFTHNKVNMYKLGCWCIYGSTYLQPNTEPIQTCFVTTFQIDFKGVIYLSGL